MIRHGWSPARGHAVGEPQSAGEDHNEQSAESASGCGSTGEAVNPADTAEPRSNMHGHRASPANGYLPVPVLPTLEFAAALEAATFT